jgi:hypothetical protein
MGYRGFVFKHVAGCPSASHPHVAHVNPTLVPRHGNSRQNLIHDIPNQTIYTATKVLAMPPGGRVERESLLSLTRVAMAGMVWLWTVAGVYAVEEPQSAPVEVEVSRGDVEETPNVSPEEEQDMSIADRIKWLNQVTTQVTDELNVVHPPPLKDVLGKAMSSDLVKDIQGVNSVIDNVVGDLKDGFVGLKDTITHFDPENPTAGLSVKTDTPSSSKEDTSATEIKSDASGTTLKGTGDSSPTPAGAAAPSAEQPQKPSK